MKKVLYIYGYNSNENSETRSNLQKVLSHNFIVDSIHYNQLQPNEAIEYLSSFVENEGYDAVIGSSLGGFYTLQLWNNDINKIVINPCMMPSVELPKIGCPQEIANRFIPFQEYKRNDMRTFGFFGNHDELIDYKDKFVNEVSFNVTTFQSGHRPTLNELADIAQMLKNVI